MVKHCNFTVNDILNNLAFYEVLSLFEIYQKEVEEKNKQQEKENENMEAQMADMRSSMNRNFNNMNMNNNMQLPKI